MPQKPALSRKQETFLLAYISLPTMQAACAVADISDDTARRWLKLPEVQALYQEMRQTYLNESLTAIIRHTSDAIATIARNMKDEAAPPSVQVRAAQIMIDQAIELNKISTLEAQIEELKTMLQERTR